MPTTDAIHDNTYSTCPHGHLWEDKDCPKCNPSPKVAMHLKDIDPEGWLLLTDAAKFHYEKMHQFVTYTSKSGDGKDSARTLANLATKVLNNA